MMKDPLEERILAHVADRRYQPCGEEQLAAQIGVVGRRRKPFAMSLAALVTAGRLTIGPRGLITLPPPPRSVTGLFRRSRAGFGFELGVRGHEGTSDTPQPLCRSGNRRRCQGGLVLLEGGLQ